jgi:hypothetical protein
MPKPFAPEFSSLDFGEYFGFQNLLRRAMYVFNSMKNKIALSSQFEQVKCGHALILIQQDKDLARQIRDLPLY